VEENDRGKGLLFDKTAMIRNTITGVAATAPEALLCVVGSINPSLNVYWDPKDSETSVYSVFIVAAIVCSCCYLLLPLPYHSLTYHSMSRVHLPLAEKACAFLSASTDPYHVVATAAVRPF
jgi:hypothetical protein